MTVLVRHWIGNTIYMRIFHAYFFWNLAKKNCGAHIIWNKIDTAPPSNKWSCHSLRSEVRITCQVDYGYKILSLIHSKRKAYDNWRSRKHWKPCSGKNVRCERKLYSWLAQKIKCDLRRIIIARQFATRKQGIRSLKKAGRLRGR